MARRAADGLLSMRGYAGELPRHFAKGFSEGSELARDCQGAPDRPTFVVGMGGSGAAGEFADALIRREATLRYECLHSPELPASVGPRSRVILLSYSGNTWEVLRAAEEARRRGARCIVFTSGGALRARAESAGDPLLLLPPELPPRAAIGFTFGGLLGFLDRGFPETLEDRVENARSSLARFQGRVTAPRGTAGRITERLGDRMPIIYGEPALSPVARRWAYSFEENAKRLSVFDHIPESLHNALVGWDGTELALARRLAGILLEWEGTSPELRRASGFLGRSLEKRGARVIRVALPGEDLLEALLAGIMLGDFVSLAAAERTATDPLPVNAIDRYYAFLARPS